MTGPSVQPHRVLRRRLRRQRPARSRTPTRCGRPWAAASASCTSIPSPAFLTSLAASLGGAPVHDTALEYEAAEMWLAEQIEGRDGAEAVLLEGHPAEAACEWARESGCDVLVVASHRGRVERVFVGSFAGHVAHNAPCPVLLIPPDDAP